jgi:trehalose 6-phosphate phosphatase
MDRIFSQWEKGRTLLLLLDYDGTLVPICSRPEDARPTDALLDVLSDLADWTDIRIAVLSGRPLAEIREFLPLEGIFRAGCHGAEMDGPGGWTWEAVDREGFRRDTARFRQEAADPISRVPGAFLEDKGLALAVHTRLAAREEVASLLVGLAEIKDRAIPPGAVETVAGKEVWEIRPPGVHKGVAVEAVLESIDVENPLAVAIGDDRTDRDTFRAVRGMDGISILVGPGWKGARADVRMPGPGAVVGLLQEILAWRKER